LKRLLLIPLLTSIITAQPFIPKDPNETILTLNTTTKNRQVSMLLQNIKEKGEDLNKIAKLLTLYLQLAKKESDLRYMGYAQAILTPLLKKYPNNYMLTMHSVDILQYTHHFDEALLLLQKFTFKSVKTAKPYLITATIYQAQKNYPLALSSCKKLLFRASHLLSTTCISTMQSHLGKLPQSYELLAKIYAKAINEQSSEKSWALTSLSEMAYRLKQKEKALFYLEEALKLNPNDYYALKKSADIHLENRAYEKVEKLLENFEHVDALLLRLTVAKHQLKKNIELKKTILQAHINTLHLRKEKPHQEDIELLKQLDIK
jgi:tetratricopeptide (TPR) repeat protein